MTPTMCRYGFFHVATHERLILLPSAPLLKRLSLVTAGPRTAPAQAMAVSSLPPPSSPYKETTRIPKWGRMLEVRGRDRGGNAQSWGVKPSKAHKLRKRIYKGIPDRWRSAAWQVLMNNFSRSAPEEDVKLKGRYYQELDKASSYDIQIDLDVPRTSSHILFRTRYGLGCVLVFDKVAVRLRLPKAAGLVPCFTLLLIAVRRVWLCAGHGSHSCHASVLF